jgi:zinc/manganese transport system permease protein
MGFGVGLALLTVWASVAVAYLTDLPVGFLVGGLGAVTYALARVAARPAR